MLLEKHADLEIGAPVSRGWDFNDLNWLRDRLGELYNIEAR